MTHPENHNNRIEQSLVFQALSEPRTVNKENGLFIIHLYDDTNTRVIHYSQPTFCQHAANELTLSPFLFFSNIDNPAKLHLEQGETDKNFSYHADALGSVRLLSDSSKDTAVSYTYLPYGESTQSAGTDADAQENKYRFTAREFEQDHFTYYRSRYYANKMGRFFKKDTYPPIYERPLSINRYLYVEGNPDNVTDPFGYSTALGDWTKLYGGDWMNPDDYVTIKLCCVPWYPTYH